MDGAVAVIPENQAVMLCRIIGRCDLQKFRQRLGRSHIGAAVRHAHQPSVTAFGQIQQAVTVTGNIGRPFAGAACIDDHVVLLKVDAGGLDLFQIVGGRLPFCLQVGSDHINHDGILRGGGRQFLPSQCDPGILRLLGLIDRGQGPAVFRGGRGFCGFFLF